MSFVPFLPFILVMTTRASFAVSCAGELDARYGLETSAALHGYASARPTLRAEPGSLAARDPAILVDIARLAFALDRGPGDEALAWASAALDRLARGHADPRLSGLVATFRRGFESTRANLRFAEPTSHLSTSSWAGLRSRPTELTVAALTAGERLHLGPVLADLHPELAEVDGPRELDVVAIDASGVERWIEVKNWARFDESSVFLERTLVRQSDSTRRLRERLGARPVRRELVLRHGIAPAHAAALSERTGYDRIDFLFPETPEDLTRPAAR